jgi:hypothetical protein|tara:strand:+ start:233 stop:541 length:309 start_codon:yes stop_codon:yes gene_type:complete
MKFLSFLFIIFGLYGIINPNDGNGSYKNDDLMQAWGIYSVTLGLLIAMKKKYYTTILFYCFLVSIIWHLYLIKKNGMTAHHKYSIAINTILLLIYSFKNSYI